jgi:hypothetical protein
MNRFRLAVVRLGVALAVGVSLGYAAAKAWFEGLGG